MINKDDYDSNVVPGKFEGEPPETEYFHCQMLNGDGEEVYTDEQIAHDSDFGDYCDDPPATLFQVSPEEAEAFGLCPHSWFLLWEDSVGFAYGQEFRSKEGAIAFWNGGK